MKTNSSQILVSRLLRRWEMVSRVLALTPHARTAQRCKLRLTALDCALSRLSALMVAAILGGLAGPDAHAARVEIFTTSGPSMLPTLPAAPTRIAVNTDPAAFARVEIGSIVILRDPSAPTGRTCHRVFEQVAQGVYWTKGDANRMPDRVYLTRETFVGLVVTPLPAKPARTWGERLAARRIARVSEKGERTQ